MSKDKNCFFCGSECEIYPVTSLYTVNDYRCKYCGQYLIDRCPTIPEINKKENKFKMACILNERRLKGEPGVALSDKTNKDRIISDCPMISVSELLDEFPKRPGDFRDRALLNLSRLVDSTQPFEIIRLGLATNKDYLHLFTKDKQRGYDFLHELANQGYIRFNRVQGGEQWDVFSLTNKCWEMVDNLLQTDKIESAETRQITYLRSQSIQELIAKGENHTLEFKETFQYNIKTKNIDEDVRRDSLKTIAGFLNSDGGTLLIGISDSGEAKGIARDRKTMNKADNDRFELSIRNYISNQNSKFEPLPIGYIKIEFENIQGLIVCVIDVQPLPKSKISHFENNVYVRDGNQTLKLTGRELTDWTKQRD